MSLECRCRQMLLLSRFQNARVRAALRAQSEAPASPIDREQSEYEEPDKDEAERDFDEEDASEEGDLPLSASEQEETEIHSESALPPPAAAIPYTMPDRYPTAARPHPSIALRGDDVKENWRVYLALVPPGATQDTLRHMGLYPPCGHDEASGEIAHMHQIGTTAGVIKEGKPLLCEFARYVRPALTLDVVVVLVRMHKCLGSLDCMFLCDQTHRPRLVLIRTFLNAALTNVAARALYPTKTIRSSKRCLESHTRERVFVSHGTIHSTKRSGSARRVEPIDNRGKTGAPSSP
jgi:hypothetical protein